MFCYDVMMILSQQSINDLQWCCNKINCSKNNITKGEPVIEISFDTSSFGWRAVCNNTCTNWASNLNVTEYHINAKERLTATFSLKKYLKVPDARVKLLSGNTTTVHGIKNMHSNKSDLCHSIISEIRTESKNIWITAYYIPRKENYDADAESHTQKN